MSVFIIIKFIFHSRRILFPFISISGHRSTNSVIFWQKTVPRSSLNSQLYHTNKVLEKTKKKHGRLGQVQAEMHQNFPSFLNFFRLIKDQANRCHDGRKHASYQSILIDFFESFTGIFLSTDRRA